MPSSPVIQINGTQDVRQSGKDIFLQGAQRLWFVMFWQPGCGFCRKFMPSFAQLAEAMQARGITLGAIDLQRFPNVIDIMNADANNVFAPVTSVPFFGLFLNGKPIGKYSGRRNTNAMMAFLLGKQSQLSKLRTGTAPMAAPTNGAATAAPLHLAAPGPGIERVESAFSNDSPFLTVRQSGNA